MARIHLVVIALLLLAVLFQGLPFASINLEQQQQHENLNHQQISPVAKIRSTKTTTTTTANEPQSQQARPHLLEQLLYRYGSDKSKDDHGYTDMYQMIFNPIRHQIRNLTEVGVSAGQSLQAWYHYFPNAEIHSYDIEEPESVTKIVKQMGDRVRFSKIDLLEQDDLTKVGLQDETMDVVVDDATHMPWQQQLFLERLFRLVKPGGYYIVEDINLNHEPANAWQAFPEKLRPEVQAILQQNDAVFVDTAVGHRDWKTWLERTERTGSAVDHVRHNSHLMILRKRVTPLPPIQMNLRRVAMNSNRVVLD